MLVIESALSVWLASASPTREMQDELLHFDSNFHELILTSEQVKTPDLLMPNTLEGALAEDLATIPQVRHVLTEWTDGPLLVWIAADGPEPDVRRRIYQKELELITVFPEVEFDFNLIPAMNRSAEELATGARVVYSRPE